MVRRRASRAACALAVAGFALAACSGGGDDGAGATTRPTDTVDDASAASDSIATGSVPTGSLPTGSIPSDSLPQASGDTSPTETTGRAANGPLDLGDLSDELGGPALDDVDLSALRLSALGELLAGPGLEQRIEDNADVDVEITRNGFFVDSHPATFTVDADGNFTITVEADTVDTGTVGSGSTENGTVDRSSSATVPGTITGTLDLGG